MNFCFFIALSKLLMYSFFCFRLLTMILAQFNCYKCTLATCVSDSMGVSHLKLKKRAICSKWKGRQVSSVGVEKLCDARKGDVQCGSGNIKVEL